MKKKIIFPDGFYNVCAAILNYIIKFVKRGKYEPKSLFESTAEGAICKNNIFWSNLSTAAYVEKKDSTLSSSSPHLRKFHTELPATDQHQKIQNKLRQVLHIKLWSR